MLKINSDIAVAIFWDHQNVNSKKLAVPILNFANSKGNLIMAKIYDNWNAKQAIKNNIISISQKFECINVPENYPNAVDSKLEIDLTRAVAQIAPDWIILITGDRYAFSAMKTCLIHKTRVTLISERHKCAKNLDQIADEVRFTDELLEKSFAS